MPVSHLPAPTLALGGTLDDTRQIQQLYVGTFVLYDARDAGKGCELIRGSNALGVGEGAQQGTLWVWQEGVC